MPSLPSPSRYTHSGPYILTHTAAARSFPVAAARAIVADVSGLAEELHDRVRLAHDEEDAANGEDDQVEQREGPLVEVGRVVEVDDGDVGVREAVHEGVDLGGLLWRKHLYEPAPATRESSLLSHLMLSSGP